jgi:thioredoxin family protein
MDQDTNEWKAFVTKANQLLRATIHPAAMQLDKPHSYAVPERLRLNHWALSGDWTMQRQATVLNTAGGRIANRFHARDLHLVMGPATPGTSVRCRVRIDGRSRRRSLRVHLRLDRSAHVPRGQRW